MGKMCQSNTTITNTKHIMWQQGYTFQLSLSHLQALMIQIRTKKVLCIVGSPMLTISVVNEWVVMNEWVGLECYTNTQDDFLHYTPGGQPPQPWHASCFTRQATSCRFLPRYKTPTYSVNHNIVLNIDIKRNNRQTRMTNPGIYYVTRKT